MHKMLMDLMGFALIMVSWALITLQFYRCFKPSSKSQTNPSPAWDFWLFFSLFGFVFFAGLDFVIWSFSLCVWMSGNPDPDWWGIITIGGLIVMVVGAILSVVNVAARNQ
jgi:hypothetical protein